jgi:D-glycero-alpha-D-manno-heptose-7-phosphate kinase
MQISRTPLRISLGGGGTDLPAYYEKHGGFLIAAAITKYIYISVHENFDKNIRIKYSKIEDVKSPAAVKHPIVRETLNQLSIRDSIEISSLADIPAGTGLGSSGSFTVGLLKALNAHLLRYMSNEKIAEEACRLEIEILRNPIGKQDQYIAALGGVTAFEFFKDGKVQISSVRADRSTILKLQENLLLFYTGIQRSASDELSALGSKKAKMNNEVVRNLDLVKKSGYKALELIEMGRLEKYALMLTEQWKLKFERSPSSVHKKIDDWIKLGIASGALGGKLIGAGGGGFLMFYCDSKDRLRKVMSSAGFKEVEFKFDFVGTTLVQH